jgi:hypothetical protein
MRVLKLTIWWHNPDCFLLIKGHSTPRTSVAHKKALYEPTLEWIFVRLNYFSFARNLTLFHWFFVHCRRHVCWIRGWSYECRDVSVIIIIIIMNYISTRYNFTYTKINYVQDIKRKKGDLPTGRAHTSRNKKITRKLF